jgi:membrane-bound lytic murein transglycosylase B
MGGVNLVLIALRSSVAAIVITTVAAVLLTYSTWAAANDYLGREDVEMFIDEMVSEHDFSREDMVAWFTEATKKQNIIDAISRPAEKRLTWKNYRKIFVTQSRINKGVIFWKENQAVLDKAEQEFGVPASVIVAIIGVETRYGQNKGSYRVIDALSTLGFDYPPRATFFRKELKEFFLLAREQKQNPEIEH